MTTAPAPRSSVVVGHDGSPAADAALQWAVERAVRRRSGPSASDDELEVVRAFDPRAEGFLNPMPPSAEDLVAASKEAQDAAEDAVAQACAAVPGSDALTIRARAERGRAARVLAEASTGAALLVVGRRGAGAIRQLLGTTSGSVLRAARCPVAVIPAVPSMREPTAGRIVVGIDGSTPARQALAWAAAEAATTGAPLDVVIGWQITTLHDAVLQDPAVVPPLSAYEGLAREMAADAATAAVALAGLEPASVTSRAVHRLPAKALLEASLGAGLLVVGSRGQGGFAGLVIGSTSDQVSRHAACPVVVVRRPSDPVEDEPAPV